MTKKTLPALPQPGRPAGLSFELPRGAAERWNPAILALAAGGSGQAPENTITILEPIGLDPWTGEGFTAKRMSAALRAMQGRDCFVQINSPGGDVFEGVTIYNQLREYPGRVTVQILGLAASAASVIAMAGDEVLIGRTAFLMIHNAWGVCVGNKSDMQHTADMLAPIDAALAGAYQVRSGIELRKIASMMDAETWIDGEGAVEQGFADGFLASDPVVDESAATTQTKAVRAVDTVLAKAGMPRAERRRLFNEIKGTPSAARDEGAMPSDGTPCAAPSPSPKGDSLPPKGQPMLEIDSAAQGSTQPAPQILTPEALKAQNPALYAQVSAIAVKAEIDRQQGVRAQALAGHEALIDAMVADGKTTPGEAAMAVNAAERAAAKAASAAQAADAPEAVKPAPVGGDVAAATPEAHRQGAIVAILKRAGVQK